MIKGIKFVSIPVSNQDASIAFYTEKLGFYVATDQPFNGKQRWVELGIPGAQTRLVLFNMDGDEARLGKFQPMSFFTDNVEATYEELAAKGVHFLGKPEKQPWGTFAKFADPDGNTFVLSAPGK